MWIVSVLTLLVSLEHGFVTRSRVEKTNNVNDRSRTRQSLQKPGQNKEAPPDLVCRRRLIVSLQYISQVTSPESILFNDDPEEWGLATPVSALLSDTTPMDEEVGTGKKWAACTKAATKNGELSKKDPETCGRGQRYNDILVRRLSRQHTQWRYSTPIQNYTVVYKEGNRGITTIPK